MADLARTSTLSYILTKRTSDKDNYVRSERITSFLVSGKNGDGNERCEQFSVKMFVFKQKKCCCISNRLVAG